jgi:predicted unusual protein kinase regulating ubiquinone biosynthesis (AarF/ABC1/UbiB family)
VSDVERPSDVGDKTLSGDGFELGRLRRAAPLVALSARVAGEAAVVGLWGRLTGADSGEFHARTAERYAELLGRSKGALMKAGQALSFAAIGHVVPADLQPTYQTALARLRSDAPPMAPELARTVLECELGRLTESVFAEFEWEPLAAASIGQVHAARLQDGRAVAVKIQYPGVADAIRADLKNGELLATFLSLIVGGLPPRRPNADVRGVAREMSIRITEELDYRLEAANQAEFAKCYRGHPFIHVPEVISELCTDRVLTQELVQGYSWSDAVEAGQELRDQWAEAIHRFGFGSHHRIGLVNSDPHPGNYLFHEDGSVSFLDFGCVKRYDRDQVEVMDLISRECFRKDVLGTWRASVEVGFFRSSDPVTPEEVFAFMREDREVLWAEKRYIVTPESVARWVERRTSLDGPSGNASRHFNLTPEFAFMGRMELCVAWVIAQLHAGNRWGAIAAERFANAEPLTEMGKRDREFFEERREAQPSL